MLYRKFKEKMPSNEVLCLSVAEKILNGVEKEELKLNFSAYIDSMNDGIYQEYLVFQKEVGQHVLEERASYGVDNLYSELDAFYMSIFQSRKSRAGGAFEFIIREMFKRLGYSFSEQVVIDGAQPDFVMPSEEYFRKKPLDCIIFTAKRTLRERWRQVVTEANKGYGFFLATIDQKVSQSQIEQMASHKVYMVVPSSLKNSIPAYGSEYNVLSFEDFFLKHLDPAVQRWN